MQQLITNVSEVTDVLNLMEIWWFNETDTPHKDEDVNLKLVRNKIDIVRHKIIANNFYSSWRQFFIQVGGIMIRINTLNQKGMDYTKFGEFLLRKHQSYGAEPFADWREVAILMRLGSKIARLINLEEDPDINTNNESFQDTFKDVIGYCVLGYYIDRLKK